MAVVVCWHTVVIDCCNSLDIDCRVAAVAVLEMKYWDKRPPGCHLTMAARKLAAEPRLA